MYSTKMEERKEEDIYSDMKMCASRTFDEIFTVIKNSNLDFHLQLSPFSAVISLKKSLILDKCGSPLFPNTAYQIPQMSYDTTSVSKHKQLEDEFHMLENKYNDLACQFKSACETILNLEDHVVKYQKAAQTEEEKQVVIDQLNNSILLLEKNLDKYATEIKDLERSKAKAEEVSIRLNKELIDVKVKHQDAKILMQKEHEMKKNI